MSWFGQEYLSESEKIDHIHRMLRSQQRARHVSLAIKLLIIGWLVYGYHYLSLPEHANVRTEMVKSAQTQFSSLITPMVESMVGDMTSKIIGGGSIGGGSSPAATGWIQHRNVPGGSTALPAGVTPEMIRAVQESMQKR